MNRRFQVLFVLLSACVLTLRAQWDVQFTDFTTLRSYYNPAVSGTDGKLNVAATYSVQMGGYDDAPQSLFVGMDLPAWFLSARHGVGVSFFTDNAAIFSSTKIGLQYAYNRKLGKKGRLAIGVAGGMLSAKAEKNKMELEDNSDPAFPSASQIGNKIDLSGGLYYYHPKMWFGISGQHLLAPTIHLGQTNDLELKRVFYLMGGCNIKFKNSLISLQPAFLVQSDFAAWREDVQCKVMYEKNEKKFYGGVGYSPNTSATLLLGGVFHGIKLGYSYQLYTGGVGAVNGSHEAVLSYQTDLDMFKKGRNKHQSVRWL